MSAARRKGKWVGGTPVLGYDVDPAGGRLMVNDKEATRVRESFALFIEHHSLPEVVAELTKLRRKTKSWTSQNGRAHSGKAFAKASLRRLLTNAIYAGIVEHRVAMYAGDHPSSSRRNGKQSIPSFVLAAALGKGAIRAPQNALLAGLLLCKSCQRPMIPTLYGQTRAEVSLLRM
jgi:site-specific DNA recombinase